jgi:hypothetical protein
MLNLLLCLMAIGLGNAWVTRPSSFGFAKLSQRKTMSTAQRMPALGMALQDGAEEKLKVLKVEYTALQSDGGLEQLRSDFDRKQV